jgi:hypothetical protein
MFGTSLKLFRQFGKGFSFGDLLFLAFLEELRFFNQ